MAGTIHPFNADYFSFSYSEAREKFVLACEKSDVKSVSFPHTGLGPNKEELATDVALFGPTDSSKFILMVSGTHGVEGLAGAGCMTGWIESNQWQNLPKDTSVLLINFINPHGAAWCRRQTVQNIDLNRNFVNHGGKYPANPGYDELHEHLLCAELDGLKRTMADGKISAFREQFGDAVYFTTLMQAQYVHPDGLFFGGREPVYANNLFRQILRNYAKNKSHISALDFHTGLGPFGYGTLITLNSSDTVSINRTKAWYGRSVVEPAPDISETDFTKCNSPVSGLLLKAVDDCLPEATKTLIGLEYGTFSADRFINAYRNDCWMQQYGDPLDRLGKKIRAEFLHCFYPNSDDWLRMVWDRSVQVTEQTMSGVSKI